MFEKKSKNNFSLLKVYEIQISVFINKAWSEDSHMHSFIYDLWLLVADMCGCHGDQMVLKVKKLFINWLHKGKSSQLLF
jgi:hypothetical protein